MDVKQAAHAPGLKPFHPIDRGTTQRDGVTIRDYFAVTIYSGVAKLVGDEAALEGAVNFAINSADCLIAKLYPPPVSMKIVPADVQKTGCEHTEVIFNSTNGIFQCTHCKQAVDPNIIQARTKKK